MQTAIFYLVHIHSRNMDHYALRDSLENAREEVFQYAQSNWSIQFPDVERPASKAEVVERYFQAIRDDTYVHLVDITPEGNWVMEEISAIWHES